MLEKQNNVPIPLSKFFNWLVAALLSAAISIAWYQIGFYLYQNFGLKQLPQLWGIPIVFLMTHLCCLFLLKKWHIPLEKIKLPVISKRSIIYIMIFSAVIAFLFLTRYKIVNTQGPGFYKVDRWTGSTYFVHGVNEIKVNKRNAKP